jgi:hypothetical protein
MSDVEMEVLARLVEANDLEVVIHGWGVLQQPRITFGDHRVSIAFRLEFNRPAAPMPVHFFDLELRTRSGLSIFRQRQSALYAGKPLEVMAGFFLDMVWDIAIHSMSPALVKMIKPGAIGLTSRRTDTVTGDMTETGNMQLTPTQRQALDALEKQQAAIRKEQEAKAVKATIDSGAKVQKTETGVIFQEVK